MRKHRKSPATGGAREGVRRVDAVIVTHASAEEIAALVLAVRERQTHENYIPCAVISQAVRKATDGIAQEN